MLKFNPELGADTEVNGENFIVTKLGAPGYVAWGHHVRLDSGRYCIIFDISPFGEVTNAFEYGYVDIVADAGRNHIVKAPIIANYFTNGSRFVRVDFVLPEPTTVESRVHTQGNQQLLIGGAPTAIRLTDHAGEDEAAIAAAQFPDVEAPNQFFLANLDRFRWLHQNRVMINILDGEIILDIDGARFYARELDDLHFINEIFIQNVYNISLPQDTCIIDIGMNIGLATLFFARKPTVKEIHSFEPFVETYTRAISNFKLNTELSLKVSHNNYALSDKDEQRTIRIRTEGETGSMSIRDENGGRVVTICIREAAAVLGPIIEQAIGKGFMVVAKIDCEGSEYEIFESLEKAGLIEKFSAFMVEWHPCTTFKHMADLTKPLLQRRFVIIDRTVRKDHTNGIFYAVRSN